MNRNFISIITTCILLFALTCLITGCVGDKTSSPATGNTTTTTAPAATSSAPASSTAPPTSPATSSSPPVSSTQPAATTASDVLVPIFPPLGMGDTDKVPRFLWSEVAGAASYEFQLSIEPAFVAPIISTTLTTTQYYYADEPLAYSLQYYWRVRPIGSSGTPGNWCETQYFTVCPDC